MARNPAPRPRLAAGLCGLYRGQVVAGPDPQGLGRLLVACPDVFADPRWAMPCAPVAGPGMGVFVAPPAGAQVWLQFEAGDPERPVWVGGYWSSPAELPPAALAGADIVLQSSLQNGLVISDLPGPAGGLLLRSASGATIRVTDTGIAIENGQGASIVLSGPTVTINGGALEIV